jgi:hypothetical protein
MKTVMILLFLGLGITVFAQVDPDKLSLDISKAEEANMKQLQQFMWRRETVVTVDGKVKVNALSEMSFDTNGKLEVRNLESKSTDKDKRGLRGKMQDNAREENMEYVEKALQLTLAYTYMSKGGLIDFFSKAQITESNGIIQAVAKDVQVKGDLVTFNIDSKTMMFVKKSFSSLLGKDPISGEIEYGTFSTGESHATKSVMNLTGKKAVISSVNKDYTKRVQ